MAANSGCSAQKYGPIENEAAAILAHVKRNVYICQITISRPVLKMPSRVAFILAAIIWYGDVSNLRRGGVGIENYKLSA